MAFVLEPLTAALAAQAAEWLRHDEAGQREFGGFYGSHPKWWDLVRTDPDRHGWIVVAPDGEPVGFVDFETTGECHLSYYVRSEFRGRGLCPELVQAALGEARLLGAPRVTAAINPENSASLACCRRAGLVEVGTNRFGEVVLQHDFGQTVASTTE